MKRLSALLATVVLLPLSLHAQLDNFDDGNLDDWTQSDVLAALGGKASLFTLTDENTFRLQTFPSPNPEALGASRAGIFYESQPYTDVTAIVDVVDWDPDLPQDVGILVRASEIGLGTTTGYALTYDVDEQAVYLSTLTQEAPATIATEPLPMLPDRSYRYLLSAIGDQITAVITESARPDAPLLTLTVEDTSFTSGVNGLFTNSGTADGTTDATFDNFSAFDPAAPLTPRQITSLDRSDGNVSIGFQVPIQTGSNFFLESSVDLQNWSIVNENRVPVGQPHGQIQIEDDGTPDRFFRLRDVPPRFSTDFESGADGWTTTIASGTTEWELGTPAAPDLTSARSGANAYGTDLDGPYDNSASSSLRSPLIDLEGIGQPELSFWYFVDVTEGAEGVQLQILDEGGDALFTREEIFWTATESWTEFRLTIPTNAREQKVMFQWNLLSDPSGPNGSGFFLDDVEVD